MLPAVTRSPPNTLTPRNWALLSRPLRVAPWPFLCAIAVSYSEADAGDLELGERLAVAALAAVALATADLEDDHLLVATLRNDLRANLGAGNERRADRDLVTAQHEHFAKLEL